MWADVSDERLFLFALPLLERLHDKFVANRVHEPNPPHPASPPVERTQGKMGCRPDSPLGYDTGSPLGPPDASHQPKRNRHEYSIQVGVELPPLGGSAVRHESRVDRDRKSTRLNSSHI